MKDPRDKSNDKSIAPKADHLESSGQSSGDSTGSGSAVEKSIKSHQRTEVRPALISNPIAQVFEQVTKAVDKAQQNAGDLTNAAINAVTHNDLGKQFADNVSPELANDYQKGKALIAQRISQGHASTDMSGLDKVQKRQVEAYHKLHSELPAKIPFYNQEALSRQIDLALSQKTKSLPPAAVSTTRPTSVPQPQTNRSSTSSHGVALPGVAKDATRSQAKSSEAKSAETKVMSSETKAAPVISSEVKASEPKVTEARAAAVNYRSTVIEQSSPPKTSAPLKSSPESLADTRDKNSEGKNTDTTLPQNRPTPATKIELPLSNRTYATKFDGRAAFSDDHQSTYRGKKEGGQTETKLEHKAQQNSVPKIVASELPNSQSKAETKTETKTEVLTRVKNQIETENRSLPNTKASVENTSSATKSSDHIEQKAADKPLFEATRGRDPIGQMLRQVGDATIQSAQKTVESAGARTTIYDKASPLYLEMPKYRTFDRLIKNNLLPLKHSLDAGVAAPRAIVLSPFGGRALFVHTAPLLPHELPHADTQAASTSNLGDGASRANFSTTYVSKHVQSTAEHTSKDFVSASESSHPTVVTPPAIKITEEVTPSKLPFVQDLTDSIGTISDTVTKRSVSGGQTTSDATIRTARDLNYITGAELVFAVIVAVAGTARARGQEQQIEPVRLEAPLAETNADSKIIATADDVAQLVLDSVKLATVVRPQVIVALDDTLTLIAARLYGDASVAWLIAALNPQCQYHYHKERCLVRLKVRQVLTLPVFDDLKSFARQRKSYMVAVNILTVVEDTAVNKEVLNQTFAALLGLGSLSSDPLQKNKTVEA